MYNIGLMSIELKLIKIARHKIKCFTNFQHSYKFYGYSRAMDTPLYTFEFEFERYHSRQAFSETTVT